LSRIGPPTGPGRSLSGETTLRPSKLIQRAPLPGLRPESLVVTVTDSLYPPGPATFTDPAVLAGRSVTSTASVAVVLAALVAGSAPEAALAAWAPAANPRGSRLFPWDLTGVPREGIITRRHCGSHPRGQVSRHKGTSP
jgi:hypothetical protein